MRGYLKGLLIVVPILVVMLILLILLPEGEVTNSYGENYKLDKTGACIMSNKFVEQQLVSPASAKFQKCYDQQIIYKGDRTYYVNGYVDSQNGFGAMLRTSYSVEIQDLGEQWRLVDITIY